MSSPSTGMVFFLGIASATIVRILDTKEIGANQFKVREIHVDTEEQYTQRLAIQFTQDKCALLDNFKPGEKAKIDINLFISLDLPWSGS